jgi:hypothetical protein
MKTHYVHWAELISGLHHNNHDTPRPPVHDNPLRALEQRRQCMKTHYVHHHPATASTRQPTACTGTVGCMHAHHMLCRVWLTLQTILDLATPTNHTRAWPGPPTSPTPCCAGSGLPCRLYLTSPPTPTNHARACPGSSTPPLGSPTHQLGPGLPYGPSRLPVIFVPEYPYSTSHQVTPTTNPSHIQRRLITHIISAIHINFRHHIQLLVYKHK